MPSTAAFLLGQTRSSVLAALLLHPESSLHVRELARLTGASPGSLHRDLRAMADLGLLLRHEVGRQVHYRANVESPIFPELAGLLRKTAGVVDVLRDALTPVSRSIEFAFVYGSIARGSEHAHSDVDVMIVGDLEFADAVIALSAAQPTLRRDINPTVLTRSEFERKLKQRDGFVAQVWKAPKLWLVGDEKAVAR
ncbi:nucleotidyltransferase domain-containing protein [Ramlibacter albus]|uniref:Nucleotidyltransferase domain-containing protein n=1 Tax=Ramlibacter albus TaxID=2079448 RepID=A0A923MA83_9BURK|nr:nucleotidyltransferase domain-containing protein [Ramlibacter albus]MBC5766225.1 nucleotidyltransferase domain-containing protein [Ramlibacter albus]